MTASEANRLLQSHLLLTNPLTITSDSKPTTATTAIRKQCHRYRERQQSHYLPTHSRSRAIAEPTTATTAIRKHSHRYRERQQSHYSPTQLRPRATATPPLTTTPVRQHSHRYHPPNQSSTTPLLFLFFLLSPFKIFSERKKTKDTQRTKSKPTLSHFSLFRKRSTHDINSHKRKGKEKEPKEKPDGI